VQLLLRICFRLAVGKDWPDGDIHRHLYLQDILTNVTEVTERSKVSEFCCHIVGCCQVFDTLEGYEHHYNALHRNMCSFCKRSFPSVHLLDTHILEWHDSLFQIMAEKQNMYQCLVEGCAEKFKSSKDRKDHLVKVHLYPSDFRFDKPKKAKSMPMDVNVETYEQLQVDSMEICPSENFCINMVYFCCRIPSTICFGQGASRGFKSMKKKV
uniref:Zinc finger protein 511 n=1 Tax=Gopherus evgoodei TaxID=1825980 RepID=A0A8C4VVN7_9SAUR